MKKTSSDRRKIDPRGREFGYGGVGEIGGGKKPLSRGKEMPLSEGRRGLHDVGWEGLPREAELGGSLMGAKRDLR